MINAVEEYKGDPEPSPPLPSPPLLPFHSPVGLPRWLGGTESTCNAGDVRLIPGLGRSPGEGNNNTPVYVPGESHGQRGLVAVPGVAKNQTRLSRT